MPPVVRVGDHAVGVCTAHDSPVGFIGTFTGGSPTVTADGLAVVRIGDIGTTDCGHHIKATGGSSALVTADGIPVHRIGDAVIVIEGGSGTASSGSPNVTSL